MTTEGTFSNVELFGDRYTVEQSLIRNKYAAYDSRGELVLRGKKKMFKMKEEFPFVNAQGEDAFTVKASGVWDVAGNYMITDARTGRDVAVLDNDFSLFQDTWRIRDASSGEMLARIDSRGAAVTLARQLVPVVGPLIPHKYEITDGGGGHVGRIDGQLSVRDRYEIVIDDDRGIPKEAIVAAAMVIDAIQEN